MKFMKYILLVILIVICLVQSGCYYDKHDVLNPATFSCDTAIVTYSGTVNPIITANCTGCHSGTNAPLNINLDLYATVNMQALNGKLLGTITHSQGFSPMPKNAPRLNDCNIARIKKWIDAGAPNN